MAGALESARREAQNAFGDVTVYLEKYIEGPRHVEIQVLADAHGTCLALGERECSIQRRHQKMIEEAPSVAVTPELRARMGAAAVAAARAAGYVNAGTCEFLLDRRGAFYFLEMKTRIQVEHPVTELVTGLDLVQWQLRIAAGERLPFTEAPEPRGWAIECRITSEDPASGFLPSTGRVTRLALPTGPGVRWDGGIEVGSTVGLYYDPMLAKLIVHAPTRAAAIARMRRALDDLVIDGVATSADFHRRLMDDPAYQAGDVDIQWLEGRLPALLAATPDAATTRRIAVAAALLAAHERPGTIASHASLAAGAGTTLTDGASAGAAGMDGGSAWWQAARRDRRGGACAAERCRRGRAAPGRWRRARRG
ncbi:MAG: acetyl-CoA carboxylase biotin carboxylase subunit, partial [Gemmatimonadota bacterium]